MRLIGTLQSFEDAERFSWHLKKKGIESKREEKFDPQSGHLNYQIWVHDEDQIQVAASLLSEFLKNPQDDKYPQPPPPQPKPKSIEESLPEMQEIAKRPSSFFTTFMISLCVIIYLFSTLQMINLKKEGFSEEGLLMTPIQSTFLFDLPPAFEKLEKMIEKYQQAFDSKAQKLPSDIQSQLEIIQKTPFWQGIYTWTLYKAKGKDTSLIEGPLFYQIGKGELWRLFTPCLLHGGIFHILFNMIWVWVLGRPIEERLGFLKTALLTLILGIVPNVVQYLISGPFFLGYSGVVMGLAGFTWMREKKAPWEGYPLNKATILFLLFFIGVMFALQSASFLLQVFTKVEFEPNIANSAHIAGALMGALLGRFSYFSWRVK